MLKLCRRVIIVLKVSQQLVCIIHDTVQVITNPICHIPNIGQSANLAMAQPLVIVFLSLGSFPTHLLAQLNQY